jgi:hypothetical protein
MQDDKPSEHVWFDLLLQASGIVSTAQPEHSSRVIVSVPGLPRPQPKEIQGGRCAPNFRSRSCTLTTLADQFKCVSIVSFVAIKHMFVQVRTGHPGIQAKERVADHL